MVRVSVILDGSVMASALAFLGVMTAAVSVNNQMDAVTTDCYERLAIGQRLHANDVYKTIKVTMLQDCQIACTQEKETCRSFSYGVGLKGNTSCEMSSKIIKETSDFKPIGTMNDTDYDLYVKKIGCKLVIEISKNKPGEDAKPVQHTKNNNKNENQNPMPDRPEHHNGQFPEDRPDPFSQSFNQDYSRPSGYDNDRPAYGFMYAPNFYGPPIKVQSSLMSISPVSNTEENNVNRVGGYEGVNRNYLPYNGGRYPSYITPGIEEQQDNSLDYGSGPPYLQRRPSVDRLPLPFSTNYGRPQEFYAEEGSYEHSSNHFSTMSFGNVGNPYNSHQARPEWNYEYGIPQNSNLNRPVINYQDDNYPMEYGDSNFVDHRDHGHGLFQYRPSDFNRPFQRPNYKPEPSNGYFYNPPPADFSDYSYGNYYPSHNNEHSDEHPALLQRKPLNESNSPNKTGNFDNVNNMKNTTGYDFIVSGTESNSTEKNTTLISSEANGSIVSHTVGPHGETITSIITELKPVCFRRALSGKRVTHYIARTLTCESLDDCRQECATEKSFVCEGFNYRYSRGQGICELLDRPLSVMDTRRCVLYDSDADYYERDRNGDSRCGQRRFGSSVPSGGGGGGGGGGNYYPYNGGSAGGYYDYNRGDNRRYDYYGGGGNYYDSYGGSGTSGSGYYQNDYNYDSKPSCKGCQDKSYGYDYRRPVPNTGVYEDRRQPSRGGSSYDDQYRPYPGDSNKYGDLSYHQSHHLQRYHHYDYHYTDKDDYDRNHYPHRYQAEPYLPKRRRPPSYDNKSYEPYLPLDRKYGRWPYYDGSKYNRERERDRNYWGLNKKGYTWGSYGRPTPYYDNDNNQRNSNRYDYDGRKNYYLPSKVESSRNWGVYGGSYGTGAQSYYNRHENQFDYWGFSKPSNSAYLPDNKFYNYGQLPPHERPATAGVTYLPAVNNYDHPRRILPHTSSQGVQANSLNTYNGQDNHFAISTRPEGYNFIKEECSLRTAAGFKLRRPIIKKVFSVPNIYECEAFCFAEKEFRCGSYAYRYTVSASVPSENCYLSIKDFKQLDYYVDLEPDKNFDVYTMNNLARCEQPLINRKVESECFWRVRSSYRLADGIVRDSLHVDSIVDCQIHCLKSYKFTCRAFSFRYGPRVIGSTIDNCLLTDWPYYEISSIRQLVPESGFELYERGSFGYGCEPDHFRIRAKPQKAPLVESNQLCYIGFGSPQRLLPSAIRKSLFADTELECKTACSRSRDETLLQCMSFSYRAKAAKGTPNCDLSDIVQRDLLSGIDYIDDTNSWLFAWDDLNPDCTYSGVTQSSSNRVIEKEDLKEGRHGLGKILGVFRPLETWRMYSVNGWPCRSGCRENREAGFWFCELEGEGNLWDYCCRPDHYCGHSQGFPYRWCYVGPERTQWRKCSDKYYPYYSNRDSNYHENHERRPYLPNNNLYLTDYRLAESTNDITDLKPPYRRGARPDRPPAIPETPPQQPSLNVYEEQFDNQFLDPPKPGGFGPSRHWPVSYLHKETPFSSNSSQFEFEDKNKKDDLNPKFAAIKNLIDIIKSNDLKNVKYQISNDSSKPDDVLFVKIPLPANFSQETGTEKTGNLDSEFSFFVPEVRRKTPNLQSSTSANLTVYSSNSESAKVLPSSRERSLPVYRRSFIERTNVTSHGRQSRIYSNKFK